ncbi:MAG: enoyl-CoA hydratase/isomerase family protein [Acidobacteriaceae bacterium]
MSDGQVHLAVADGVAKIVFDRPIARNAMTWEMYDQLLTACSRIAADADVRVATFRGVGGAFVAGTDIRQFQAFASAEDGIAYERRVESVIAAIETLPVPTIAVVEGAAMGGGLIIATACDLRIAGSDASFGAPIARTVGNCLSVANTARLVNAFGPERTKRILLLAESISAEEALACGFVTRLVAPEHIEETVIAVCQRLLSHAPISMRVARESIRRLCSAELPEGDDLIRLAYGSEDFQHGVRAFLTRQPPRWRGR